MVVPDQAPPPPAAVPAGWADPGAAPAASPSLRRWSPLLLWSACLLAALVLLRWFGAGRLATPPVTDPVAWWSWAAEGDPLTVTMAALRVLAIGLTWYLTGATSISVLARVLRAARLVRLADALSIGPVRVVTQQAVGVGLATGVLVTAVPMTPVGPSPAAVGVAIMVPVVDASPAPSPSVGGAEAAAPAGLAMRDAVPVPVPAPALLPTHPPPGDEGGPAEEVADVTEVADVGPREHRVRAGDHFWSIAETEVGHHLGRAGTDDEVLAHWELLVDANADRLVVHGNPDLLLPGQRIVLPEVAS